MAKQPINTLKSWFKTGLKPLQQQFWDWMDSFWHKDEKIPADSVEGLQDILNGFSTTEALQGVSDGVQKHLDDTKNPHNVTATQIGLGNVDNTSDADKPISNAVSEALAAKLTHGGDELGNDIVVGSNDEQDVVIKTNNVEQARIDKNGKVTFKNGLKVLTEAVLNEQGGLTVDYSDWQRFGATKVVVGVNSYFEAYDGIFSFLGNNRDAAMQLSQSGINTCKAIVLGKVANAGVNNSYLTIKASSPSEFLDITNYPTRANYYSITTALNWPDVTKDGSVGVRAPLKISARDIVLITDENLVIEKLKGVGNRLLLADNAGNIYALPAVVSGERVVTQTATGVQNTSTIVSQIASVAQLTALASANFSTGSANVTGSQGQYGFDANYRYDCTSDNVWIRTTINVNPQLNFAIVSQIATVPQLTALASADFSTGSANVTGSQGQYGFDANYRYDCTSDNVWIRTAINVNPQLNFAIVSQIATVPQLTALASADFSTGSANVTGSQGQYGFDANYRYDCTSDNIWIRTTININPQLNFAIVSQIATVSQLSALASADFSTGSANVTGSQGQYGFDSHYRYDCIGTNTWKRTRINDDQKINFFLEDLDDSQGDKSSTDLNAIYPSAVVGQWAKGNNNMYIKQTSTVWTKFKIYTA